MQVLLKVLHKYMTFIKKSGKLYERRDIPVDIGKYQTEVDILNSIKDLSSLAIAKVSNYGRMFPTNYKEKIEEEIERLQKLIADANKIK